MKNWWLPVAEFYLHPSPRAAQEFFAYFVVQKSPRSLWTVPLCSDQCGYRQVSALSCPTGCARSAPPGTGEAPCPCRLLGAVSPKEGWGSSSCAPGLGMGHRDFVWPCDQHPGPCSVPQPALHHLKVLPCTIWSPRGSNGTCRFFRYFPSCFDISSCWCGEHCHICVFLVMGLCRQINLLQFYWGNNLH